VAVQPASLTKRHGLRAVGRLPAGWPVDASIVAESLVVRYRPDLDPVLNGLSFSIRGAPSLLHNSCNSCTEGV